MTSILDLNTEFIFLSDIRLNGRHRQMEDSFRLKYRMIHNSSQNRRGVAILIRNDVQCSILEEVRDLQENVLCMRVELSGREIILGSVYGPNINDLSFYDFLHNLLLTVDGQAYHSFWAETGMLHILNYLRILIPIFYSCVHYPVRSAPVELFSFARNTAWRILTETCTPRTGTSPTYRPGSWGTTGPV